MSSRSTMRFSASSVRCSRSFKGDFADRYMKKHPFNPNDERVEGVFCRNGL